MSGVGKAAAEFIGYREARNELAELAVLFGREVINHDLGMLRAVVPRSSSRRR